MSCINLDMSINDLADFVFNKNTYDKPIELSLPEIENWKEFFYFCLDLLCKGLVLLYGCGSKVDLDEIDEEKFNVIKRKMECMGIRPIIEFESQDVSNADEDDLQIKSTELNIREIEDLPDNKQLEAYIFKVTTPRMKYSLHFTLIRCG
jgi:hypothetical protein